MSKPWIQTYRGWAAYPLAMEPCMVSIGDIAHHLSNICRYTGAPHHFYSVAEHSVHVSRLVPKEDALAGLLHDASEAYLNDSASPLKGRTYFKFGEEFRSFAEVEADVQRVICVKLQIPNVTPPSVKEADLRLLQTERGVVLSESPMPWGVEAMPYEDFSMIQCWTPAEAEWEFLHRYIELRDEAEVRP